MAAASPASTSKDSPQQRVFSVRIVDIDHYMARPVPGLDECYSQLEGTVIDRVPIIRIFGSTPSGQKTCVHVHRAFPYFYVPYETGLPEDPVEVGAFMRRLASSIESASQASMEQGAVRRQRVFGVHLVRGRKFYGYHAGEQLFLKIILYNPTDVGRVATLLQSGQILGRQFDPYESHIPFLLQFKVDFNLFGMGHMQLEELHFRAPVPESHQRKRPEWHEAPTAMHYESSPSGEDLLQGSDPANTQREPWTVPNIPLQWLPENAPAPIRMPDRQSCCELEADVSVEHILNRRKLVRKRLEEAGQDEQLVESLIPMWDEERLRSGGSLPPAPGSPVRQPGPLCQHVEDVRAQFQSIATSQQRQAASQASQGAPNSAGPPRSAAASPPSSDDAVHGSNAAAAHDAPIAATPVPSSHASQHSLPAQAANSAHSALPSQQPSSLPHLSQPPAATPAGQLKLLSPNSTLLMMTPAANLATSSAVRGGSPFGTEVGRMQGVQEQDESPAGDGGGEVNLWGDAPIAAVTPEEMDAETRELMEWMQIAEADSDEEGGDPLMELARQASTQPTPGTRFSQQEVLKRLRSGFLSQSQREADDIMEITRACEFGSPPVRPHRPSGSRLSQGHGHPEGVPDVEDLAGGQAGYATGLFADDNDSEWEGLNSQLDAVLAQAQREADLERHVRGAPEERQAVDARLAEAQQRRGEPEGQPRNGMNQAPPPASLQGLYGPRPELHEAGSALDAEDASYGQGVTERRAGVLEEDGEAERFYEAQSGDGVDGMDWQPEGLAEQEQTMQGGPPPPTNEQPQGETQLAHGPAAVPQVDGAADAGEQIPPSCLLAAEQGCSVQQGAEVSVLLLKLSHAPHGAALAPSPRLPMPLEAADSVRFTPGREVGSRERTRSKRSAFQRTARLVFTPAGVTSRPIGESAPCVARQERRRIPQVDGASDRGSPLREEPKRVSQAPSQASRGSRRRGGEGQLSQGYGTLSMQTASVGATAGRSAATVSAGSFARQAILPTGGDAADESQSRLQAQPLQVSRGPSNPRRPPVNAPFRPPRQKMSDFFGKPKAAAEAARKEAAALQEGTGIGQSSAGSQKLAGTGMADLSANRGAGVAGLSQVSAQGVAKGVDAGSQGSSYARLQLQAMREPEKAAATHALRRSRTDVRRTHALSLAARKLLRGLESSDEEDPNSAHGPESPSRAAEDPSESKPEAGGNSADPAEGGDSEQPAAAFTNLLRVTDQGVVIADSDPDASDGSGVSAAASGAPARLPAENHAEATPTPPPEQAEGASIIERSSERKARVIPDSESDGEQPLCGAACPMPHDTARTSQPDAGFEQPPGIYAPADGGEEAHDLSAGGVIRQDSAGAREPPGAASGSPEVQDGSKLLQVSPSPSQRRATALPAAAELAPREQAGSAIAPAKAIGELGHAGSMVPESQSPHLSDAAYPAGSSKRVSFQVDLPELHPPEPDDAAISSAPAQACSPALPHEEQAIALLDLSEGEGIAGASAAAPSPSKAATDGGGGLKEEISCRNQSESSRMGGQHSQHQHTVEEHGYRSLTESILRDNMVDEADPGSAEHALPSPTHGRPSGQHNHSAKEHSGGGIYQETRDGGTFPAAQTSCGSAGLASNAADSQERSVAGQSSLGSREEWASPIGSDACKPVGQPESQNAAGEDVPAVPNKERRAEQTVLPAQAAAEGSQADSRLHVFRTRSKPPSQAALNASMPDYGIMPIVAACPFYGNPSDVPARPTVFSGMQFKLPSSAVVELPAFRSGNHIEAAAARAHFRAQVEPGKVPAKRTYAMVPARRPPAPKAVHAWLQALRAQHRQQPLQSESPASFGMDPNTGKLLPGAPAQSQDDGGGYHKESELLGTPSFASPALDAPKHRHRGRSCLAVASQAENTQPSPQERVRPGSPKYDERSSFFATPAAQPRQDSERMRPSSPKYDERTFFYATPQVDAPPAAAHPWRKPAAQSPAQASSSTGAAAPGFHRDLGPQATLLRKRKQPPGGASKPGLLDGSPLSKRARWVSQITGPSPLPQRGQTPVSQAGFKWRMQGKGQQLTLLSVEVHADSRGTLLPDPRYDTVRCIIMAVMDDDEVAVDLAFSVRMIIFDDKCSSLRNGLSGVQIEMVESEKALLEAFIEAVKALDPDMLVGWEVQQGSIGYLIDRATLLEVPLLRAISRTPEVESKWERQADEYGQLHGSGLHCSGRLVLNLWRLLRSEVKLNIYTFESCVAALLQLRTPHLPPWLLTHCFNGGPGGGRWRTLEYWSRRARLNLALLEQLDLVGRTGELARAFGIAFFDVLTRGSQYRVESLLARLAHSQNYLLLSPSKEQVARQPAMECIPLVMEPESTMYSDPVIVLDYQSLYPSQIIAYNLCFCTCLGRTAHAADPSQAHKLGASSLCLPAATLQGPLAPDRLTVSPNGVAWAPPEARAGVVPRLLQEILKTRIMVKAAMKRHPASAKVLQRVLNARQFGLKLIANVTYGYAAAGFSGRMPMAELADAIVQSGRQTLENTITMVEGNPEWRARVVYGDTDSLFVLLPGRSKAEAFRIGAQIAAQATAANPSPVTLKMEKVYQPCVLASKKRYVGFMYEDPGQSEPTFDAKGIETVRRDSCPVVAKMLERSIRILFTTHDLSQVKEYAERQWDKILSGRVSLADFVFAKEVRMGTYTNPPAAAHVASRAMAQDPRAEPRYCERIPYVVVHGPPGARLQDVVFPPHALVEAAGRLRLNARYYIIKQIIPALERVLSLVGADVRAWYANMSRPQRLLPQKRPPAALPLPGVAGPRGGGSGGTIDRYYLSRHCAVCDGLTHAAQPLCETCRQNPQLATGVLSARAARLERHHTTLVRLCLHCGGGGTRPAPYHGSAVACDSLDCALFFERRKTAHELAAALALADVGLHLL